MINFLLLNIFFFKDLFNTQHHSVYIPNYLQAFDYPNADETPSPFQQQQDQFDDRYNEDFDPFQFDFFQTTSTPSIQFLSDTFTSLMDIDNGILITNSTSTNSTITTESTSTTLNSTLSTTEQTTSTQNSTHLLPFINTTLSNNKTSSYNEIIISSTLNNTLSSTIENKSISSHEQINDITEHLAKQNLTLRSFLRNNTDLIFRLLNRTSFLRKNLAKNKPFDIYNATPEETARHLADRKTMQSLIHLIPPNLWSQLQNNFSTITFNQSQYTQQAVPDSAILAEAAAHAGLTVPGPNSIPDHLWHQNPNYYRNPPQIMNNIPMIKPTPTCNLTFFLKN